MGAGLDSMGGARAPFCKRERRPRCGFLLGTVREGCAVRRTGVVPSGIRRKGGALLTHHAKGWDPLCGFYRRSCLSALTDYIKGRSFQHWLAQHPVQLLPLPDAQMLFNCNTPMTWLF